MKTIYIARHGQTDMNVAHTVQGTSDTVLNTVGISQAHEVRKKIDSIQFDCVISSPLKRAFKTAEILSGFEKETIKTDKRLMELDFGEHEGLKYTDKLCTDVNKVFSEPQNYHPSIGESYYDLVDRIKEFFEELKECMLKSNSINNVLTVTHGGAFHAFLLYKQNLQMQDFWNIPLYNCAIYKLEFDEGKELLSEVFRGYSS